MSTTNTPEIEQLRRTAEMFEMILSSAPMATENYESLKDVYRQLGDTGKLKDTFLRLAEQNESSGNSDAATAELKKALEEFPGDPDIESRLADRGFTPPSSDFDKRILDYEDLCIQCEDVRVQLRLSQHAIEKAKSILRAAREDESMVSNPGELSKAIERILDSKIESIRSTSPSLGGDELERLRATEREKLEIEFPARLAEARAQAERNVQEKQSEHQRTTDELSELEDMKTSMESFLEKMIANLPHEKRGRAKAEFLALSDGVILIPLDEDIVEDEEPVSYASSASRIDMLARDLNLLEAEEEESPVEAEPEVHEEFAAVDEEPDPEPAIIVEKPVPDTSPDRENDEVLDRLSRRLGAMLMRHGVITEKNLNEALEEQKTNRQNLGLILARLGYASEAEVLNCLSKETGMPYLPLGSYEINPKASGLLPARIARKYCLVPVDMISNNLLVCTSCPIDSVDKREIEKHTKNMKLSYYVSSPGEVDQKYQESYPS